MTGIDRYCVYIDAYTKRSTKRNKYRTKEVTVNADRKCSVCNRTISKETKAVTYSTNTGRQWECIIH